MGLGAKAVRAVAWTTVDKWTSRLVGIAVFAVLARSLSPADFGLAAIALTFTGFADIVASQGLGFALVIRKEVTDRDLDACFWANVALGAAVALVLWGGAAVIGFWFGQVQLAAVLFGITIAFLLNCFGRTHAALLTRNLSFRTLALRNVLATVAGGAAGVALAYRGWGAMAIVGQQVATAALGLATLWWATEWRPRREFSRQAFLEVWSSGRSIFADRVVVYIRDNVDVFLVGLTVGMTGLGVYAVAKRVIDLVAVLFVQILQSVVYPVFSQAQHDLPKLVRGFERSVGMAAVALVPLFIGTGVMAPEALRFVVGPAWEGAAPLVCIMAIAAAVSWIDPFAGAVLFARQKVNDVLVIHVLGTVTSITAVLIGGWWGVTGIAVAVLIRRLAGTALLIRFLGQQVPGLSPTRVLRSLAAPAASAGVMGAVVAITRGAFEDPVSRAVACVPAGAFVYIVTLALLTFITGSKVLGDLISLVSRPRTAAPASVGTREPSETFSGAVPGPRRTAASATDLL